jgi:hypothetical protein
MAQIAVIPLCNTMATPIIFTMGISITYTAIMWMTTTYQSARTILTAVRQTTIVERMSQLMYTAQTAVTSGFHMEITWTTSWRAISTTRITGTAMTMEGCKWSHSRPAQLSLMPSEFNPLAHFLQRAKLLLKPDVMSFFVVRLRPQ